MPSSRQAWGPAPSIPTPTATAEHANKTLRGQPCSDMHVEPWPVRVQAEEKSRHLRRTFPLPCPPWDTGAGFSETPRPASTESWEGSPAAPCWPRDHWHRGCAHPASPSPWRSHQPQEHAPLVAPEPKAKVMKKLFQAVPRQALLRHGHPCTAGNIIAAGKVARKGPGRPQRAHSGQKSPLAKRGWGDECQHVDTSLMRGQRAPGHGGDLGGGRR